MMAYENRMLTQGSGIKESNRRLGSEKLQSSYFSTNIIVTKGEEIKKNKAGTTNSMHQTNKNGENFQLENLQGKFHLQDLGID
jgi:hypothetical protein